MSIPDWVRLNPNTNPDTKFLEESDNGIVDFFLAGFDVPKNKRNLRKAANIRWLLRNLGVRNSNHPDFKETTQDLKDLLRFCEKS